MKTLKAKEHAIRIQIFGLASLRRIGTPEEKLAALDALAARERELNEVQQQIREEESRQGEFPAVAGAGRH